MIVDVFVFVFVVGAASPVLAVDLDKAIIPAQRSCSSKLCMQDLVFTSTNFVDSANLLGELVVKRNPSL